MEINEKKRLAKAIDKYASSASQSLQDESSADFSEYLKDDVKQRYMLALTEIKELKEMEKELDFRMSQIERLRRKLVESPSKKFAYMT